jgi:hypothetical protein
MSDFDFTPDDCPPARRRPPATKLLAGLLAGCGLVGLLTLLVVAAAMRGQGGLQSSPAAPAAAPAKGPSAKDPYPECAAVRKWLRENTGEPDKLEIIAWKGRREATGKWPAGAVWVSVKYRGVNQYGGRSVEGRSFLFDKSGKVLGSVPERWPD